MKNKKQNSPLHISSTPHHLHSLYVSKQLSNFFHQKYLQRKKNLPLKKSLEQKLQPSPSPIIKKTNHVNQPITVKAYNECIILSCPIPFSLIKFHLS